MKDFLEKEFNFNKAIKNPYIKASKKPVTLMLDDDVFEYFKQESNRVDIPLQVLINMYLKDCMLNERHLTLPAKN